MTDTFGFSELVRPTGDPALARTEPWCMYQLAELSDPTAPEGDAVSNLFFVTATLVHLQEGAVLEEVILLRDELANLAWAVERRLESPMERCLDAASYDTVPTAAVLGEDPVAPCSFPKRRCRTSARSCGVGTKVRVDTTVR